jgi:hypothetical protein
MFQEERKELEMKNSLLNRRTFILTSIGSLAGGLLLVQAQPTAQLVQFETIKKAQQSAYSERRNYVITSKKEWKKLWNAMHAFQPEPPPLPEVDFDRKMLLAVFQGYQPPIADITITSVSMTGNSLTVQIKEKVLGKYLSPPCPPMTANVITPYHIVQVDRLGKAFRKRVAFESVEEIYECP